MNVLQRIPYMPGRETDEKFSHFLSYGEKGQLIWKPENVLKRNFELYKQHQGQLEIASSDDNNADKVWLKFWVSTALGMRNAREWEFENYQDLALGHLTAFFEELGYWCSKKLFEEYGKFPWDDYFSECRLCYQPQKLTGLLNRYNPEKGASLATYVRLAVEREVLEKTGNKRISRWKALHDKGEQELREALQSVGLQEPKISCYLFARKYFRRVYRLKKGWPVPSDNDIKQILSSYNSEKELPTAPHAVSEYPLTPTASDLRQWLEECIDALNSYQKLRTPILTDNYEFFECQKEYRDDENRSDGLIVQEENTYSKFVAEKILTWEQAIASPRNKKILMLYYGFGWTQTDIRHYLKIDQATVSRNIGRERLRLINAIKEISNPAMWSVPWVQNWLNQSYGAPNDSCFLETSLVKVFKVLDPELKTVLRLRYGQNLTKQKIASQLDHTIDKVSHLINQAHNKLTQALLKEIEALLQKYSKGEVKKYYQAKKDDILSKYNLNLRSDFSSQQIDVVLDAYVMED